MAGLADWLEDYRNWRGRQDWESGKGWQDFFGGDPRAQEQFEMLSGGFGTGSHGVGGLAGIIKSLPYQIEHKPMTIEGGAAPLHDLLQSFGEEIYDNPRMAERLWGSGLKGEKEMIGLMQKLRGKPEELVDIYRGVPEGVTEINPGDWVTLHPRYAEEYGNVISKKVPAKYITSWPDSLVEFGYHPK